VVLWRVAWAWTSDAAWCSEKSNLQTQAIGKIVPLIGPYGNMVDLNYKSLPMVSK
jgi:hypothetical protein